MCVYVFMCLCVYVFMQFMGQGATFTDYVQTRICEIAARASPAEQFIDLLRSPSLRRDGVDKHGFGIALRVCSAWLSGKRDQTTFGPASAANSWPCARRSRGACAVWAMSHTRASRNLDFGFEVRFGSR